MNISAELVALAKKRLADLEDEKAELLALLRRHDAAPSETPRENGGPPRENGHRAQRKQMQRAKSSTRIAQRPVPAKAASRGPTLAQQRGAKAFRKMEGGPTDAILAVLQNAPSGLGFSEVVTAAVKNVQSHAANKTRSVGNVLLALRKSGKVAYHEGKYYAPLAAE